MKHVLSIQDLSCVGRCSLTVTAPVLSAMGCRCSVLPTAILSTHTGFPNPEVISLTDRLAALDAHWQSQGIRFDAVLTGYLADPQQAEAVLPLVQRYKAQGSRIIVDPAMGDHGKLYSRLNEDHVFSMSELCKEADILLPNLTEAVFLTEIPYREETDGAYLRALTGGLLRYYGVNSAIITGIPGQNDSLGFCGADKTEGIFAWQGPRVPRSCHGTGDLFAAVFTGALLREKDLYESAVLAAEFVRRCVENTPEATPHGVSFETMLPWLWEQLTADS